MKKIFVLALFLGFCVWAFPYVEKSDGVKYRAQVKDLQFSLESETKQNKNLLVTLELLQEELKLCSEEVDPKAAES